MPFPILFGTTVTTVLHYRADCDVVQFQVLELQYEFQVPTDYPNCKKNQMPLVWWPSHKHCSMPHRVSLCYDRLWAKLMVFVESLKYFKF